MMHTARLRAHQSQAQRPSRTQRRRGVRGLPRLRYNTTRPRAQQAKRSEEGAFLPL